MNKNNLILWILIVICVLIAAYALVHSFRLGQNDGRNTAAAASSSR